MIGAPPTTSQQTGLVFDIKRCAIHDGPGIRTTVFLKGCPLRCLWCHNPESVRRSPQIKHIADNCIACGRCAEVCPVSCHQIVAGRHVYDRAACTACGQCTEACPTGALERIGVERDAADVIREVAKDRAYFERSGGGLTVSGGEPLIQSAFSLALLELAKAEGLHTCLDTCGHVPFDRLEAVLGVVDLFLFDLKETDPARHRAYTGVDQALILENLRRLDARGASLVLRCPIVPGLNDRPAHLRKIGELASELGGVREVNVMGYHPYGGYKSAQIGVAPASELCGVPAADREQVKAWQEVIRQHTSVKVATG